MRIVIVMLLVGVVVMGCETQEEKQIEIAQIDITKSRIDEVRDTIEIFCTKMHRYPSSDKGLEELMVAPEDEKEAASWIKLLDKIPVDAWNRPLQYELIDGFDGPTYRVYSFGPDGIAGTDDDISSESK
jgi:general secretion pathway protein G